MAMYLFHFVILPTNHYFFPTYAIQYFSIIFICMFSFFLIFSYSLVSITCLLFSFLLENDSYDLNSATVPEPWLHFDILAA